MTMIPVRNLTSQGGLNADAQPNSLNPAQFTRLDNVRARAQRIERVGDTLVYQDAVSNVELDEARAIFDINLQGSEGLLMITADAVYYDIGSGWIDITPSYSVFSDNSDWQFEQYGDSFIITCKGSVPYVYEAGAAYMEEFTDWPAGFQAGRIFAYKNFLIAVDLEINNNIASGRVIWSDVVVGGDLINVEWTNLASNLAGSNTLPDGSGAVLDGGVLRDSAILYTDRTVWRMDVTSQVAGLSPLVFNFRRIFADDGILAPRCFVDVGGVHHVIGVNRIYVHDGIQRQYPADNRVNNFFYSQLGSEGFAFVTHYPRTQEILYSYATRSFTQANEAIVFNYLYNFWSRWVFNDSAGVFKYITIGPEFDQDVPTWGDLIGNWADFNSTTWGDLFPNLRDRVIYALDNESDTIYQIDSDTENTETPQSLVVERLDIDLDEVFEENRGIVHMRRMIPLVSGEGEFTFEVGGRNNLAEPVVFGPPITFTIGTDYKLDFRVSYRFPAFRITQTSAQGSLSMTGYDLDARRISMR